MPGTPHHALGDPLATALVVTVVAAVVVIAAVVARSRSPDYGRVVIAGAIVYGAGFVLLWAVVRVLFWRFATGPTDRPVVFFAVVGVGFLVLALQGAVALYLYGAWELKTPLAGLFVCSWVCGYLFMRVGGESGALFTMLLWAWLVAPPAIAGIVVLGATEAGAGRLYRTIQGDHRGS